jgi:signal transduction histidine kinase
VSNAVPVAELVPDTTRTVNILIVDDEPANLLVLETVLADPGYRLVRASSGDEALMALIANDFAVLVLDVHMPGISGFELAQLIKQRRRTAHIPIIFLTAYYSEDQHILAGYGSGAVDYLHKPVNPIVLRAKVSVFAELHRKSAELEAANRQLEAEVIERRWAEERLNELNESLDRRVTERTVALRNSEAQLLDAHRRKDEFLATLAHELRNPLAPIRNAVQLLRLQGLDPECLTRTCDLVDRQVRSMARLIEELMDISRINQGRIELRPERVAIGVVLQEAIETTRPLIEEYEHELTVTLPEQRLAVLADSTRLAQAFSNLLNNAAKYMDRGGRIELEVRGEADEVSVSVKDAGIGIPQDKLGEVFEMFAQVESAISRTRGGLGIGLSLTRSLIELHGGSVCASSAGPGAGSEFIVRLPLVHDDGEIRAEDPSQAGGLAAAAGSLKILVADDNDDAAVTTTMLLEAMGHTVRRVGDGSAAIQAAAEFRPDVALLDIGMPKVNGYEACSRIRQQAAGAPMTIIAVTGWGTPADVRKARESGFDHHLVKPVEPAALLDLIGQLAALRRQ